MLFTFDLQNILLIITGVMNTFLGILIYAKHRNIYANQIYILNIAFILWWIVSMIIYRSSSEDLLFWSIMLYATPTVIASTFAYFSLFFPEEEVRRKNLYLPLFTTINVGILALLCTPGAIIVDAFVTPGAEHTIVFGPWYPLYALYISGFFGLGLLALARKYFTLTDQIKKRQLVYLLAGYLVASGLAMGTNLILPWLGYFKLNWLGQVLTACMVIPVTYAAFKHRLFAANVIATELLIGSLWIFLLVQTLLAKSQTQQLTSGLLLGVVIILGYILMRSVNREVHAREKIETLATDLAQANERLRELDRQKTEFVSIASHQLRSPLTAIKGYASLLLEGSFGKLPAKAKEAVERIFDSSRYMALSIEDFLNVSRIELGTIKYDMKETNLFLLGREIVKEMQPGAKEKGLTLTFSGTTTETSNILGDYGKLRQVVLNIVDNAMKYTPKGHIAVSVIPDRLTGVVRLSVSDTGVGIPKDVLPKLFQKFSRADNANEVNVMGTGLGLYVAKEFVEAHHGKIWAESEGQEKGSRFIVEFPLPKGFNGVSK